MRRCILGCLAVLSCTLLAGCGDGVNYVAVSGKVTYNGAPLANVQVMFQPNATGGIDAGGVGSFAMTDSEGKFTLEAATPTARSGALVGNHQVRIAFPPKALNGAGGGEDSDAANSRGGSAGVKQPIPAKYNSETTLTFSVPAGGTSTADFSLTGPALKLTK